MPKAKVSAVLAVLDFSYRERLTIRNLEIAFEHSELEILLVTADSSVQKEDLPDSVTLLRDERKGIHAAYNVGLRQATGDWIFFLGSGDQYVKRAGELLEDLIKTNPDSRIMGFASTWVSWKPVSIQLGNTREDRPWDAGVLIFGLPVSHQGIFCHREVFSELGPLDPDLKTSSDFQFIAKAFKAGFHMATSSQVIAVVDDGGVSSVRGDLVLHEHGEIVRANFGLDSTIDCEQIIRIGKGWVPTPQLAELPSVLHESINAARKYHGKRNPRRRFVIMLRGIVYAF